MGGFARVNALVFAFAALLYVSLPPRCAAAPAVGPSWATKLVLYNRSNTEVTCMVVVQSSGGVNQQDGCPNGSVSALRVYNLTKGGSPVPLVQFSAPTKGWFKIPRGHKVQLVNLGTSPKTGLPTYCMAGIIIGFGQIPDSCPDDTGMHTDFPDTRPGPRFNQPVTPFIPLRNGSTGVEVTINLPGTINGQPQPGATLNETVDITCLAGANCTLIGQLTPPAAGPYWSTDFGPRGGGNKQLKTSFSFRNSWVDILNGCDDNCVDPNTGLARPGVFPYGCSQCNEFPDIKPQCTDRSYPAQFCAAKNGLPWNNGCSFVRSPKVAGIQKFGGTFQVTYLGPLSPPRNACR